MNGMYENDTLNLVRIKQQFQNYFIMFLKSSILVLFIKYVLLSLDSFRGINESYSECTFSFQLHYILYTNEKLEFFSKYHHQFLDY